MIDEKFINSKIKLIVKEYEGDLIMLEKMLGFILVGYSFGWRQLFMMHCAKTIRRYEKVLDIKIKYTFPEYGEHCERSLVLPEAKKYNSSVLNYQIPMRNRSLVKKGTK